VAPATVVKRKRMDEEEEDPNIFEGLKIIERILNR
jgi:hypothetical protein